MEMSAFISTSGEAAEAEVKGNVNLSFHLFY